MLRITKVMGCSSGTPPVALRRKGSFSLARGYWRCSGCTPTAWVGTRTKRRGREDRSRGTTRSAGVRGNSVTAGSAAFTRCGLAAEACGAAIAATAPAATASGFAAAPRGLGTTSRGSATVLPGQGSAGIARFVALISPLRDETSTCAGFGPTSYFCFDFLELPHACAVWDVKMALQKVEVNLWKNMEVSYPLTHSNGT